MVVKKAMGFRKIFRRLRQMWAEEITLLKAEDF
jgi:hypothetical protein